MKNKDVSKMIYHLNNTIDLFYIVNTVRYYIAKVENNHNPLAVKHTPKLDLAKNYNKAVLFLENCTPTLNRLIHCVISHKNNNSNRVYYDRILKILA